MANDEIEVSQAADDSEWSSLLGVHRRKDWFEEEWEQAFEPTRVGASGAYIATSAERAVHGARGVAEVLARDERSRMTAESAGMAYEGLSPGDRESLAFALEALHETALAKIEHLRERLLKVAKSEQKWVEIPVVGPAQ